MPPARRAKLTFKRASRFSALAKVTRDAVNQLALLLVRLATLLDPAGGRVNDLSRGKR